MKDVPLYLETASHETSPGQGAVLGMAHRGRLNVLANIMGKSYDQIFKEFEGHVDPSSVQGSGDVKYHLGASGKYESPNGASVKIELAANPSHLETVDPIVMGMVRAQQDQIDPPNSFPALSLLIHGDADPVVAFSEGENLAEAMGKPLWRIEGGRHLDTWHKDYGKLRPELLQKFGTILSTRRHR